MHNDSGERPTDYSLDNTTHKNNNKQNATVHAAHELYQLRLRRQAVCPARAEEGALPARPRLPRAPESPCRRRRQRRHLLRKVFSQLGYGVQAPAGSSRIEEDAEGRGAETCRSLYHRQAVHPDSL